MNSLRVFWNNLIGDGSSFSLEARIFNGVCVLCLLMIASSVPLIVVNELPEQALFMTVFSIVVGLIYYLSRFRSKHSISVLLFGFSSNAFLIYNFLYNSGINGPTFLLFLLSLFLTIAVAPKKQYHFWLLSNLLIATGLILFSFLYHNSIPESYPNSLSRHGDFAYSYILVGILIYLVTDFIRQSYHKEKVSSDQKALELQSSNETKNKLLSILAHDLRAPLGSIQNYLEILSEYSIEENDRKTIQGNLLIETINTQQMLSNILSWSKSQMDGLKANIVQIGLKNALQLTLNSQQSIASEKGINFKIEIESDSCVYGDKDMLELVIRNLLSNAIKFTAPGGQIIIDSKTTESSCIISVSDTGIGINNELQAEIFSLNANSTYGTKNEKGVGLGLALCKQFTEIQQGKIWFESHPGKGSTFFVRLASCRNSKNFENADVILETELNAD